MFEKEVRLLETMQGRTWRGRGGTIGTEILWEGLSRRWGVEPGRPLGETICCGENNIEAPRRSSRESWPGAGPRRASGHTALQGAGNGGEAGSEGPGSMCELAGGDVAGSGARGRQTDFGFMLFLIVPKTRAWQGPPSPSPCRRRTSHHTVSISDYGFNSNTFLIRGVCICQKIKTFMMTEDLMRETCSKHNSCFLRQEVWWWYLSLDLGSKSLLWLLFPSVWPYEEVIFVNKGPHLGKHSAGGPSEFLEREGQHFI